jgi:hypothetical protein
MALTSEAVLSALQHYVARGGGSRGARVLCAPSGTEVPMTRLGALEEFRFVAEREAERSSQIRVRYDGGRFEVRDVALRGVEGLESTCFERDWSAFLTGSVYGEERSSSATQQLSLAHVRRPTTKRPGRAVCLLLSSLYF